MDNFNLRKYIAEGKLLKENQDLQVTTNGNFEVDEEIYVSLGGEEYAGTIDEDGRTLFIHYYGDDEYHGRGDVPDIFNRMEELGGDLHFGDDESSIFINIDQLK